MKKVEANYMRFIAYFIVTRSWNIILNL